MSRVAHADVDRIGRIGRACRTLDRRGPVGLASQSEEVLLHREVAGIGRAAGLAERPRECDGEWLPERETDRDPQFEGRASSETSLDPTDRRLVYAHAVGELFLGQTESNTPGLDDLPERECDGLGEACRLADDVVLSSTGRRASVHAWESYREGFTGHWVGIAHPFTLNGARRIVRPSGTRPISG